MKNKGFVGAAWDWTTKDFRVSGAMDETGPWETLLEDQLVDTTGKAASLLNFTFKEPAEIQFLRFDLISYWGNTGGALQYFAPILATSKKHQSIFKWSKYKCIQSKTIMWACS